MLAEVDVLDGLHPPVVESLDWSSSALDPLADEPLVLGVQRGEHLDAASNHPIIPPTLAHKARSPVDEHVAL